MKIRLFVAIKIDENALEEIIAIKDSIIGENNFNWEKEEKLHITLKFIGDVDTSEIKKIVEELKIISNSFKSFELQFSNFGIFRRNNSSILWAGIKNQSRLKEMYSVINENLNKFCSKKSKSFFKPHVTLLRNKKNKEINNLDKLLNSNISNIKFSVNQIYLIKSELNTKGSIYTEVEKFKLK